MSEPGVSAVTFLIDTPGNEPRGQIEIEGDRTVQVGVGQPWRGRHRDRRSIRSTRSPSRCSPAASSRCAISRRAATTSSSIARSPSGFSAATRSAAASARCARRASGGEWRGAGGCRRRSSTPQARPGLRTVRQSALQSAPQPGLWLEIAGVISDFPAPPDASTSSLDNATVYWPVARGDAPSILLAVRVRGGAPPRVCHAPARDRDRARSRASARSHQFDGYAVAQPAESKCAWRPCRAGC